MYHIIYIIYTISYIYIICTIHYVNYKCYILDIYNRCHLYNIYYLVYIVSVMYNLLYKYSSAAKMYYVYLKYRYEMCYIFGMNLCGSKAKENRFIGYHQVLRTWLVTELGAIYVW